MSSKLKPFQRVPIRSAKSLKLKDKSSAIDSSVRQEEVLSANNRKSFFFDNPPSSERFFDRTSSGRPKVFSGRRSFLGQGFLKASLLNFLLFLLRFNRRVIRDRGEE